MLRSYELFELVQQLKVHPSRQRERTAHGEDGSRSHGPICDAVWRESLSGSHQLLALRLVDGNLLVRLALSAKADVHVRQVPWFASPQRAICCMVLDSDAEWLVCACRDASLALVPVYTLLTGKANSMPELPNDDITLICPLKGRAPAMCLVWWRTLSGRSVIITGSVAGELVFIDLVLRREVIVYIIEGVITSLQLMCNKRLSISHLLIATSDGRWWRMLLEVDVSGAMVEGYEVIQTYEGVGNSSPTITMSTIENILHRGEVSEHFTPHTLPLPVGVSVTVQYRGKGVVMAVHNHVTNTLQLFDADVELQGKPLYTYHLMPSTTHLQMTDLLMFALQHQPAEVDKDPLVALSIMSMQFATPGGRLSPPSQGVSGTELAVQRFSFTDEKPLAVFACSPTSKWADKSLVCVQTDDEVMPGLPECVVVTSRGFYRCRQRADPESMFLELLLSCGADTTEADCLGVMMRLDVCRLYKVAADDKLQQGDVSLAMKFYQLSKCPHMYLVARLASAGKMEEALSCLRQVVLNSGMTGPAGKQLADLLLQCFIHQLLEAEAAPEPEKHSKLVGQLSQFINDNFNYDAVEAMRVLADHGLVEQVLQVAQVRGIVSEGLELLLSRCQLQLPGSTCNALLTQRSSQAIRMEQNGTFLRCLSPAIVVQFFLAELDKLPKYVDLLVSLIPRLHHSVLLRLARVLDPSRGIVRPFLRQSALRPRELSMSGSTSSLLSLISQASEGSFSHENEAVKADSYVELFIAVLVMLKYRRQQAKIVSETAFVMSTIDEEISAYLGRQQEPAQGKFKMKKESHVHNLQRRVFTSSSLVACGQSHAAAITNGSLYTWGRTKEGRLGHGDIMEEEGSVMPFRVEILHMLNIQVLAVSCGSEHTVALCVNGVYAWGASDYGQLGLGDRKKRTRPAVITALAEKTIVAVVCGQFHCLALSHDHRVYSWGWGVHGQLGLGSSEDSLLPSHVSLLHRHHVLKISAGYGHSAVLSKRGLVLTFGSGQYGQLGNNETGKQTVPAVVEALEREVVRHIACGHFFTVAVTDTNDLYMWGRNLLATHRSQLRAQRRSRQAIAMLLNANQLVPQMIPTALDANVKQICCGSCHGLIMTDTGRLFSWGANDHGQLGLATKNSQTSPRLVAGLGAERRIQAMSAGDQFSVVMDQLGQVWVWGRGDLGQLGISAELLASQELDEPMVLTGMPHQAQSLTRSGTPLTTPTRSRTTPIMEDFTDEEREIVAEVDLPDLATYGAMPYGAQALNVCLQRLWGRYSPLAILRLCMDWQDWSSAADVCDLLQHSSAALECHLRGLSEMQRSAAELQSEVHQLFSESLRNLQVEAGDGTPDTESLHHLLLPVLRFWHEASLSISDLESMLQRHLSVLAVPLSTLLLSAQGKGKEDTVGCMEISSLATRLSPEFFIQLLSHSVRQVTPSSLKTSARGQEVVGRTLPTGLGGRDVEQSLWADILQHLHKDLQQSGRIVIPLAAVSSALQQNQTEESEQSVSDKVPTMQSSTDMVVFSCGHCFSQQMFEESVVPDFRQCLIDLPVSLSKTASDLLAHYLNSALRAAACPVCVYNSLRSQQGAMASATQTQWLP